MHDILHRWYKRLLNIISTLKQTGCTLYSEYKTNATKWVRKISSNSLQTSDKKIGPFHIICAPPPPPLLRIWISNGGRGGPRRQLERFLNGMVKVWSGNRKPRVVLPYRPTYLISLFLKLKYNKARVTITAKAHTIQITMKSASE